jgi:hypothetical protein
MRLHSVYEAEGSQWEANVLENTPADRPSVARLPPAQRSRVTNGRSTFLDNADGRSVLARRYRDILAQLVSDIGGDPSEAESIICRRAATLAVWCEQSESAMAGGTPLNIGEFTTAVNTLHRLVCTLGLERRARDIMPTLQGYLGRVERRE